MSIAFWSALRPMGQNVVDIDTYHVRLIVSTFRYKNNTSFFRLISRYFKSSQLDFLKYSKYYLLDILGFLPANLGSG